MTCGDIFYFPEIMVIIFKFQGPKRCTLLFYRIRDIFEVRSLYN